jgi:hypothetical protein
MEGVELRELTLRRMQIWTIFISNDGADIEELDKDKVAQIPFDPLTGMKASFGRMRCRHATSE